MERTYNIPLRKEFQKAPKYKRAKKAMIALKSFLAKHMKSDDVRIGRHLNEHLWKQGIKNPPHHVKVTAVKDDDNIVKAELFGFKYEELTKEELEEKKKQEEKKAKGKVSEKVKKKPELAEEALKKGMEEDIKGEELVEELEKEETMNPEMKQEESAIKETIKEIRGPKKPKTEKVPSAHELAKKKSKTGKTLKESKK